jgi:hypothetical protein
MPRRRNNAEALAKAKEAKQKKLLYVLIPVFLGLAVWQGPKMYGALFGGSTPPEATPVATTTPTTATPAPGTSSPEAPTGVLADTDLPPEADQTKLISFSRFTGRDPFDSPHPPTDTTPTPTPTPTPPGSGGSGGGGSGGGGGGDQDEELTAVIEINGVTETVSVGEEFPASDPTFTLVALTLEGATIGVVQGMFQNGDATIEIAVGEEVTLVAAPESIEYDVKLVDVMN